MYGQVFLLGMKGISFQGRLDGGGHNKIQVNIDGLQIDNHVKSARYVCLYIHMHVPMYAYMYVCMYVYIMYVCTRYVGVCTLCMYACTHK